jgi:hypothetical protein
MASFRSHHGANAISLITVVVGLCTVARPVEFAAGAGEPNNPYQIATAEQLGSLSQHPELWDKHFVLTADIDMTGGFHENALLGQDTQPGEEGFQGTPFTGALDGRGHAVIGLAAVADCDFMGLFGKIASGAVVRNLRLENVIIQGSIRMWQGSFIGGLAGENQGEVLNCYVSGSVSGALSVGGLVGCNEGRIAGCCSYAAVQGGADVGGLVGSNASSGAVLNCGAVGWISSFLECGGLVGTNAGQVSCCYAAPSFVAGMSWWDLGGLIADNSGEVQRSYWDAQASGVNQSEGGTGSTTTGMQGIQLYLHAGWDFVGETANGTEDAWQMPSEGGYPRPSVLAA